MASSQLLICLAAVGALAGCSADGPVRYPLTGEVTLDGQPLAEGTVYFCPLAGAREPDFAPIKNGTFQLMATAGMKRIEVEATTLSQETEPSVLDGSPVRKRISLIPKQYNRESVLVDEVAPDGKNHFQLQLKSR